MDQLSKDARAARLAGVTYGKYMAMKYAAKLASTPRKEHRKASAAAKPKKEAKDTPRCALCGRSFPCRGQTTQILLPGVCR